MNIFSKIRYSFLQIILDTCIKITLIFNLSLKILKNEDTIKNKCENQALHFFMINQTLDKTR